MIRWIAVVAVLAAGCAAAPEGAPASSPTPTSVNPANIKRLLGRLPPGYEHAAADLPSPAALWGLAGGATADPPQCAPLADPPHDAPAQGVSGSGPGGIVYAVVVPTAEDAPDPARIADCASWTLTRAGTVVSVDLIDAPQIDGATTLGMDSRRATRVEGGGQIASRAYTFTAYLDGYRAVTALVVDPGAPDPPLDPRFAADLLVATVAELRGTAGPVG